MVSNTLLRTVRRNRDASGAALYQRDGNLNRYSANLILQSTLGFETYSGSGNVFYRNVIKGSLLGIGRIQGAYHDGARTGSQLWQPDVGPVDTNTTVERPDFLTGQTTFRFTSERSLIARNTFTNNNGGINWYMPEEGRWATPSNIYFVSNRFSRGNKAPARNQTVIDIGDDLGNKRSLLEQTIRSSNFARGNDLRNGFTWTKDDTASKSRPLQQVRNIPPRWDRYFQQPWPTGAGGGIGGIGVRGCR